MRIPLLFTASAMLLWTTPCLAKADHNQTSTPARQLRAQNAISVNLPVDRVTGRVDVTKLLRKVGQETDPADLANCEADCYYAYNEPCFGDYAQMEACYLKRDQDFFNCRADCQSTTQPPEYPYPPNPNPGPNPGT